MIADQAIKHFTVFRGASFESVKMNIGDVCSNAASSMVSDVTEVHEDGTNGDVSTDSTDTTTT